MAWYVAVLLGLVQGLAEFLPISSSGHLLLLEHWFGLPEESLLLTIILHLATLLAVVVVYWRTLWPLIRHPFNRYNAQLLVATVITCGLVLLLKDPFDRLFGYAALPWLFIVAGVYLWLPTLFPPRPNAHRWRQTIAMGIAQGIAVVPGLSRSGLTITTGRLCGLPGPAAADFSFLMSIPIIVASLVYELKNGGPVSGLPWGAVGLAFVTAFVAGVVALRLMLRIMRKVEMRWFAAYLLLLGSGLLLYRWFQVF